MSAPSNEAFAAALDAVVTRPELRRQIDRAPVEALAGLGVEVPTDAVSGAATGAALFAPPYVPLGPSAQVFAPPYVPLGPSSQPQVFAPPYVPLGPASHK